MLLNYIDSRKDRIVEMTRRLASIPTVNPPGFHYERIVGVLENVCHRAGLKTKRFVVPKSICEKFGIIKGSKRINLLAIWDVGAGKTLHLNGHYDVVSATGNWKTQAFRPTIVGGRLYGRGTEDMKGTIASMLCALEALKKLGIKPKVNIQVSFTPDEETGGKTGLGYLVKENLIRPDFAVGEGYGGDFISHGNKGALWLKVEVLGRSCHSSQPYKGINSFEKMSKLVCALENLKEKVEKRKTGFNMKQQKDRYATMVMGGDIAGGGQLNVVSPRTSFSIDRRLIPEETIDGAYREIIDRIKKAQLKDKQLKVKVKVLAKERAVVVDPSHPLCKTMASAIRQIHKGVANFAIMAGGTDMRYFIYKGIPAIGYAVKGGNRFHGDDEFVYIKSLVDTTKVFALLMSNME